MQASRVIFSTQLDLRKQSHYQVICTYDTKHDDSSPAHYVKKLNFISSYNSLVVKYV